uniref:ASCH domain-containing protein n=1 Tax=candidate division WWE3 bacterium TaxID=2053526 RepID=A0A832DUS4_UNCKA
MPRDHFSKVHLGDGSILSSKKRLEPGTEVTVASVGESELKLYDSAVLVGSDGDGFRSVVRGWNFCSLADIPEEDVKELGFADLYHLAESLRHRFPELTWHDKVTVLRFFVYEGYWE